jgi:hypothetical protein
LAKLNARLMATARFAAAATVAAALATTAAADGNPLLFSMMKPGEPLPKSMRLIALPKIKHNVVSLVEDDGVTVLKVESRDSAGSVGVPITASRERANTSLQWRWKIDRALDKADMQRKQGDDFAGRVYVFFDVPLESLSFMERSRIRMARAVAGTDVPTAALCYVWDNQQRTGHTQWSTYTNRVRMIVLQSGKDNVGKWMRESRDVAADFKVAFGMEAPAVTGVALGNDTDNTDEAVTTLFGDIQFLKKSE